MSDRPILAARGVTQCFGGLVALDSVDLDVPRGVVQAIIGPNGSGKTTLLNALSGASHADAGSIQIDGRELFRLKPHRIARLGLARTFQNIRIFNNLSVIENVKVAAACNMPTSPFGIVMGNAHQKRNEAEIEHRAREALDVVGLGGRADDRAAQLPYAQQRLLEIARALASKPDVLLLDEPAAGQDGEETERFALLLRSLAAEGTAVVLVEHDMGLVMSVCDEVYVLDLGKVIANGPPEVIRQDEVVLAAYLGEP